MALYFNLLGPIGTDNIEDLAWVGVFGVKERVPVPVSIILTYDLLSGILYSAAFYLSSWHGTLKVRPLGA